MPKTNVAALQIEASPSGKSDTLAQMIPADFLSADTSVTKVRLRIHDKVFIDHLNWAYVHGSFMMVAKLWHDISTVPA